MSHVRELIMKTYYEVLAESGRGPAGQLREDTILLESGLDSLGFAILVARLEDVLGYDPFSTSSEAYYPSRFGEFVSFYERNRPQ